jgi:predicted ATPase/DNA-binding SARP family transcriptional activator
MEASDTLAIHLLGRSRVVVDGVEIDEGAWERRKAKHLVQFLAAQPTHRAHREEILDALWPDADPRAASGHLRKALHAARRALRPGGASGEVDRFLVYRDQHVSLRPEALSVDVDEFERRAHAALKEPAAEAYEHALAAYGGDLLSDDPYEAWAAARREQLIDLRCELLSRFARLCVAARRLDRAVGLLRDLLAHDPLNEEIHRRLMVLYTHDGRRDLALRQYRQCRETLRSELDCDPDPTTVALYEQIASGEIHAIEIPNSELRRSGSRPGLKPRVHGNLPQAVTGLVGRDSEIEGVMRLLASTPLVTLTGAGGVGKTRLALEVAAVSAGEYPDGVWFVDLAEVAEPGLVSKAVLGVVPGPNGRAAGSVGEALERRHMLLVLDTCERATGACAALADEVGRRCPRARLLATSREPLGLSGEAVWRVAGLASGEDAADTAVRLFAERAARVRRDFRLTERGSSAVAEICRRLGGLPLAIELAASWARILTPEQILGRLDDMLQLLAGGDRSGPERHRSLRGSLDWSYALLSPADRRFLAWAAEVEGAWAVEEAEAAFGAATLESLRSLAGKSLLEVEEMETGMRYRLSEAVRRYALEQSLT